MCGPSGRVRARSAVAVNPEHYSESDCRLAAAIALHDRLPAGYILKTEVKLPRGYGGSTRGARLDMAILEAASGRIVLVIETKRSPRSTASAQGERYGAMTRAPVLYLRGIEACRDCLAAVLSRLPAG